MRIEKLSTTRGNAVVTREELNRVIDQFNAALVVLGDAAGLARVTSGVLADNSGGTSANTIAAVPSGYSQAYFQETIASILKRLNDLVRVNAVIQRLT